MQTVKSFVRPRQQKPSSVEESSPRSSSASRRRSKSMMTGQGTHFSSSHYRRPSRKDSGAYVQDDFVDAPGGKQEKGHGVDTSLTGDRETVDQQYTSDSHVLNAALGEDQGHSTTSQPPRWKSASSETPRYEPQFQNDTAQGTPPPLRSSRQRSLGVDNEKSAAVAAAASAYSGKPGANGRRVKSVPKYRPEDTGVPRKDSTTIGPTTLAVPGPVYVGEETEYVETIYGPGGTTETVDRETFVEGEPIQRETEVRTYQESVAEEPVSVTEWEEPRGITGEEAEPVGIIQREEPVTVIDEQEEPVSVIGREEEPIGDTDQGEQLEETYLAQEAMETPEDEWDKVEEEEEYIKEQWQTGEQETPGVEEEAAEVPPTIMPTQPIPAMAIAPGTSLPVGTDAAIAGQHTTTIPLGTETTATGLPVTSMSIGTEPTRAEPPATTIRSSPEATTAVPASRTMPSTTKTTTTKPTKPPARTMPTTTKKAPASATGTVLGTPWKVSDAWSMSEDPAKEYAGITTPAAPSGAAATSEESGERTEMRPEEAAPSRSLAQEPAGADVTPGPRYSVGSRSAQGEAGAHTAMAKEQPEQGLSAADKRRIEHENKATHQEKVKEDKLREKEVKREQDRVQQQMKDDEKRQKQAEKERKKEMKQQEKQQRKSSTNGSQQERRGSFLDRFRRLSRTSGGSAPAQPTGVQY